MNKLMGISMYVPLQCSKTIKYIDRVDLMKRVFEFIDDKSDD
jgi:hypothetical protein